MEDNLINGQGVGVLELLSPQKADLPKVSTATSSEEVPQASMPEGTPSNTVQLGGAIYDDLGVRVDQHSEVTDTFQGEADASIKQFDKNVTTTYTDSIKAAVKSFDFVGAYKEYKRREAILDNESGLYTPDPDFDLDDAIMLADIPLTTGDVDWLKGKTNITSQKAFDLYIDSLKESRELSATMAVNPKLSFATSFLDPTYIASGAVFGKAAKMASMSRFGAAVTVGVGELGTAYAQNYHRPVDSTELVMAAVIPPVITAGVWRNHTLHQDLDGGSMRGVSEEIGRGKFHEPFIDPTSDKVTLRLVDKETVDYISNIDAIQASRTTSLTGKPVKLVEPEVKLDADGLTIPVKDNDFGFPHSSTINWKQTNSKGMPIDMTAYRQVYNIIEDPRLPKVVREDAARLLKQGGKELTEVEFKRVSNQKEVGRYYPRKNRIQVRKSQSEGSREAARTFTHEAAHSLTALRVAFGKMHPDSVHGRLVKDIEDLRSRVEKRFKNTRKDYTVREQQEISYALQNTDEFIAGLYEGSTAFRKLMEETPTRTDKFGNERTLLQSLFTGVRRLLGMSVEDASGYVRALKLTDDLIDTPKVRFQDVDGNIKEVLASEVTPEFILQQAHGEGQKAFNETIGEKVGTFASWNLYDTFANVWSDWVKPILSNPTAGKMQDNVVSTKRALKARLDIHVKDAEMLFKAELSRRGVNLWEHATGSGKYAAESNKLQAEIAYYIESRAQAHKAGKVLPDGTDNVAKIAEHYREMTKLAKEEGIRTGLFSADVNKVDWYMPRKIDPDKFMAVFENFKRIYGEEKGLTKFVDALAETIHLENAKPEYRRHIAYIYYRRMYDKYTNVDSFSGNLGNDVVHAVEGYLDHLGVTDHVSRQHIKDLITGGLDERGKASFQRFRLDIDTLGVQHLPDGTEFRFYDMMDTGVLDSYARYADNISGRVGLASQGLGTPTEWRKYRDKFLEHPSLQGKENVKKREEFGKLIDDMYNNILGYPTGEALHPFLIAARAATNAVALKFSGIWQPMEVAPIMVRHAKANGIGKTISAAMSSWFTSVKKLETSKANDLQTILVRAAMDDLKVSPLSARLSDNYDINTGTFAAKMSQLSKYTYVVNGMRYLMSRQAVMSANLIVDNLQQAAKGDARAVKLLKKYGFDDTNISEIKRQLDVHGTDFNKWEADVKSTTLPKMMNLMDTDVLRSRLGEIPAWMQFSTVGKILGTFRNFVFTAHNKIFTSTLRDEGVLAAALLGAYQFPLAMLSVQAASIAKGEGAIEDFGELLKKAISQMGTFGFLPEIVGLLTGETRNFNSAALMSLDSLAGVANAIGTGDPVKIAGKVGEAIPIVSVTLGFQAGMKAALDAMADK